MTNEHIAARLREIAKDLANTAAARRGIGLDKAAELYSIAAELEAQPASDQWKSAVDHELVTCGATADSFDTPARAVKELIDWHVRVALDPAVSGDAAALVERGRKEAAAGDSGMPVVAHVWPEDKQLCCLPICYSPSGPNADGAFARAVVYLDDAQAAIAARDARIAEHASDGEMLDWLVRKGTMHVGGSDARGWMVSDMRNGLVILSRGHATYRDAIRAAMKETK
jgi:hypothetical protein